MTKILAISRPRFWIYLFGPYIIGLAAGAMSSADFLRLDSILFGLYFLLPANLLVYGINDIYDFETDIRNPKKAGYEMLVPPEMHRSLWSWIAVLNIPFIVTAIFLAPRAVPVLLAFILLSVFYSAPPIRAKEVAFLDSIFNVLYVLPGAFAFQMISGEFPPLAVIFAGGLWTAAMHAYSAIPDIESDTAAQMETIATKLGSWGTHMFCMVCYAVAGVVGATFAPLLILFGLLYVSLISLSIYQANSTSVFSVYRWFPFVNAICGFIIFWYVAWPKFI
jgi:4-hydroxybenzoate polyprenyltransferase